MISSCLLQYGVCCLIGCWEVIVKRRDPNWSYLPALTINLKWNILGSAAKSKKTHLEFNFRLFRLTMWTVIGSWCDVITASTSLPRWKEPIIPDHGYLLHDLFCLQLVPKGQFEYSISPDQVGADLFYVHPRTGVMTIARPLHTENRNVYILTVRATDRGTPAQTGQATVRIQVVRNQYCPRFDGQSYQFAVSMVLDDGLIWSEFYFTRIA